MEGKGGLPFLVECRPVTSKHKCLCTKSRRYDKINLDEERKSSSFLQPAYNEHESANMKKKKKEKETTIFFAQSCDFVWRSILCT